MTPGPIVVPWSIRVSGPTLTLAQILLPAPTVMPASTAAVSSTSAVGSAVAVRSMPGAALSLAFDLSGRNASRSAAGCGTRSAPSTSGSRRRHGPRPSAGGGTAWCGRGPRPTGCSKGSTATSGRQRHASRTAPSSPRGPEAARRGRWSQEPTYAYERLGIDPRRIAFVTFTRKAAEEIRERTGDRLPGLVVGTIHQLARLLIRAAGRPAIQTERPRRRRGPPSRPRPRLAARCVRARPVTDREPLRPVERGVREARTRGSEAAFPRAPGRPPREIAPRGADRDARAPSRNPLPQEATFPTPGDDPAAGVPDYRPDFYIPDAPRAGAPIHVLGGSGSRTTPTTARIERRRRSRGTTRRARGSAPSTNASERDTSRRRSATCSGPGTWTAPLWRRC